MKYFNVWSLKEEEANQKGGRDHYPTMAGTDNDKPLTKISESFKELAATVNSQAADVELASFSRACSHVSPLFGCLGIAFKFAEMDYVAKVIKP